METAEVLQKLKDHAPKLTKSQRMIADFILKNTVDVAFLTIDQLAGLVGISTSSIMRLTFSLGYSGYAEFQKELQEMLRNRIDPAHGQSALKSAIAKEDLLQRSMETEIYNIKQTAEMVTPEMTKQALDLIGSAERIYCLGARGSLSVAQFAYYRFNRLLGNCELLVPETGDLIEKMIRFTPNDLVIVCSLPRYARKVIQIVEEAKARQVKVIALTDGYSSPLAEFSDLLIPCTCSSSAFHNSVIAPMFIVDYLISGITIQFPERTSKNLDQIESIISKWNYHYLD